MIACPRFSQTPRGFVYFVSITGITGAATPDVKLVSESVSRLKRLTKLPVAVGFGVKTPETAQAIAGTADGVVVGSSIVEAIRLSLDGGSATSSTVIAATELVSKLAQGVRAAHK